MELLSNILNAIKEYKLRGLHESISILTDIKHLLYKNPKISESSEDEEESEDTESSESGSESWIEEELVESECSNKRKNGLEDKETGVKFYKGLNTNEQRYKNKYTNKKVVLKKKELEKFKKLFSGEFYKELLEMIDPYLSSSPLILFWSCASRIKLFENAPIDLEKNKFTDKATDFEVEEITVYHEVFLELYDLYKRNEEIVVKDSYNLYILGLCSLYEDQAETAKYVLKESLYLSPYNWEAWNLLKLVLNDKEEASKFLETIDSEVMKALFTASVAGKLKFDHELFLESFKYILEIFKDSSFIQFLEALYYYDMQHYLIAENKFAKIYKNNPQCIVYGDTYASILYKLKLEGKLKAFALKCYEIDKYDHITHNVFGLYYSLLEYRVQAIKFFSNSIKLNYLNEYSWLLLASEFMLATMCEDAIKAYDFIQKLKSYDLRVWIGIGTTYSMKGHYRLAVDAYRKVLKIKPNEYKILELIAENCEKSGQYEPAVEAYEECVKYKSELRIKLIELINKIDENRRYHLDGGLSKKLYEHCKKHILYQPTCQEAINYCNEYEHHVFTEDDRRVIKEGEALNSTLDNSPRGSHKKKLMI
ncbi:TPR-like protein [Neoconidiobolus thromboides FSU 785]|nr:TPR-like protein [Neoconidiobolus thromboides FSU 785]